MIKEINMTIDDNRSSEWRVEAIDDDGSVEVAIFSGPRAHDRAMVYRLRVYGVPAPEPHA